MSKSLSGKVALVTGGSRGIGAAAVRALAQAGADVAIGYVASADKAEALVAEVSKLGVRAAAFKADQAKSSEVAKLVRDVHERFGRLDILVNNAGVAVNGPVGDASTNFEELDRQLAVNIGGVVAAVRTAAPLLADGGRIISIGSCLGERVPAPGMADYSATKAALVGYTKGWARDLGKRNITVNVVAPGPIDTDMNPADSEKAAGFLPMIPLGRYGKAEEVGSVIAFLAGPGGSYINGTTLTVDGGVNA